jgi:CarD family transcriptional regulator
MVTDSGSEKFVVGDMAVYPGHGVGKISAIESREVGGTAQFFYVIRIVETNMTVMVPVTTCKKVGLRAIIEPSEVDKIFNILNSQDVVIENQPWNQRYREYMGKIKTGSVYEISEVLRDLYILQEDKTLSFGERKMLDTAQGLLIKEISLANKSEEDQVEKDITEIFA